MSRKAFTFSLDDIMNFIKTTIWNKSIYLLYTCPMSNNIVDDGIAAIMKLQDENQKNMKKPLKIVFSEAKVELSKVAPLNEFFMISGKYDLCKVYDNSHMVWFSVVSFE